MSETFPDREHLSLPRCPEQLYDYFAERENSQHEGYTGYADLAWEALGAISEAVRYGKTDDEKINEIALIPGRSNGIYSSEQTDASREFLEVITIAYDLQPVADETTEYNPYGRILWQNSKHGAGINIIEHRAFDKKGDLVKITAVSHVPQDLLDNSHKLEEIHATDHFKEESRAGIEAIPTIEVDEAALVAQYFSRAA